MESEEQQVLIAFSDYSEGSDWGQIADADKLRDGVRTGN